MKISYLFKVYTLFFSLSFALAQDFSIYKISDEDVDKAKSELVWDKRFNTVVKVGVSAAAIAGLYFAWTKAMPWLSDCVEGANRDKAAIDAFKNIAETPLEKKNEITKEILNHEAFKNITREDLLAVGAVVTSKLNDSTSRGFFGSIFSWTKDQFYAIPGVTAMVVMPLVGESIVNKFRDIFGKRTITRLAARKLELPEHFQKLKVAAVHWSPAKFLANANYENDKKLRKYAKRVLVNFNKTDADQVAEIKKHTKELFLEECNILFENMAYVIAYMKYMTNSSNQTILDNFADQLQMSTYEFANKLEELLVKDDIDEIFSEAALFQNEFNVTINNFMMFAK